MKMLTTLGLDPWQMSIHDRSTPLCSADWDDTELPSISTVHMLEMTLQKASELVKYYYIKL